MGRMIRKQVYIEPHQEALLKRRARELGLSEADLIRRSIDRISEQRLGPRGGFGTDYLAWEEAKDFIQARMRINVPQGARAWTRDELYDERLGRFSR